MGDEELSVVEGEKVELFWWNAKVDIWWFGVEEEEGKRLKGEVMKLKVGFVWSWHYLQRVETG